MTFIREDYISESESSVLSGTVYTDYNFTTGYQGFCKFLLTNKKIIQAGEGTLNIIPLNKILQLSIIDYSGVNILTISASRNNEMRICCKGNTDWFNNIVREIAKRIG